jgi:hypothetical protein
MVLSLGGYLQTGAAVNPSANSRLRSATLIVNATAPPPVLGVDPSAGLPKPKGIVPETELKNYLSAFISNNYGELKEFTEQITEFEKAMRCTFFLNSPCLPFCFPLA